MEEFSVNRNSIKINFSKKYCRTSAELLDSGGFHRILELYLKKLYRKNTEIYRYIASKFTNAGSRVSGERAAASIAKNVIELFKLLIVFDLEEVKKYDSTNIFSRKDLLLEFVEDLYNFWRSFERYALIINKDKETAVQQTNFFSNMSDFTNLVLTTYRKVTETLMLSRFKVYRQLTAGVNIGLTISRTAWNAPVGSCYKKLARIDFVKTVILQPPFFVYTKQNTRKGLFSEVSKNPLEEVEFSAGEWLCYPVKIGDYLAFVYFNIDFMAQGVTLANLFEIASVSEYKNHKPDLILIFGAKDGVESARHVFYKDRENDIIVGYLNNNESIDYFGYMKKMLLTIFNLKMIEKGNLPIHGAMINITLKNEKAFNIVLMGDSGAGKSESLEAFRTLAAEYIKEMQVIFDDMGYFSLKDGKVYGYGTEIGAFVRLDDLDKGYVYKTIDRSIFLNPDRVNARVVMPISTFETVNAGYPVEYFLYANNYEDGEDLEFFNSADEAKKVFVAGKRMAKGTTNEMGLVTSYFANPFGPAQEQETTGALIDQYFSKMFEMKTSVGQIRTRLGISGFEQKGPLMAAKKLFDALVEDEK